MGGLFFYCAQSSIQRSNQCHVAQLESCYLGGRLGVAAKGFCACAYGGVFLRRRRKRHFLRKGDDNPNIENYLGYGEVSYIYPLPKTKYLAGAA